MNFQTTAHLITPYIRPRIAQPLRLRRPQIEVCARWVMPGVRHQFLRMDKMFQFLAIALTPLIFTAVGVFLTILHQSHRTAWCY